MPDIGRRPLIALTADLEESAEPTHALRDAYVRSVWEAGGLPVAVPSPPQCLTVPGPAEGVPVPDNTPGEPSPPEPLEQAAAAVIAWVDGLLLTGGCDLDPYLFGQHPHPRLGRVSPRRDLWELALVRAALDAGRPILALCRGLQVLNVAGGGTLVQDLDSQLSRVIQHRQRSPAAYGSHEVRVHDGTRLRAIAGAEVIRVNSRHHQAVLEPAPGLVVSAVAPDGVIEALEGGGAGFVVGVQWHPEDMAGGPASDSVAQRLFRAFVSAAAGGAAAWDER
ncbi:MAG TPA: gamma-glutamyl-gamma-aminobutyrate hydrolase family protein [Bacillota bacterium]